MDLKQCRPMQKYQMLLMRPKLYKIRTRVPVSASLPLSVLNNWRYDHHYSLPQADVICCCIILMLLMMILLMLMLMTVMTIYIGAVSLE